MYKWFLAAAAVCLMGTSAVAAAEDSYYLELPTKGSAAALGRRFRRYFL